MLTKRHVTTANIYFIFIDTVKKLLRNLFDKENASLLTCNFT